MSIESNTWQRNSSKLVYDTRFLKVREDTITLPNGSIIDDYSVVEFNDVVIVVATDVEGNLITMQEYKYAVDQVMAVVPAGTIERGENVLIAAGRELLEETGRTADSMSLMGELYEYPTKASHKVSIVRAKNAHITSDVVHEDTELIKSIDLMTPEEVKIAIVTQKFKTATIIGAIVMAMPELFGLDSVVE